MKNFRNKNKGAMTLEILIAFAILILNITAVMLLINGGQSMSVDSQTNQEAIAKAQEQLANARATDFDSLNIGTTTTTDTSGIVYTKKLTISADPSDPSNENKKLVTSTINWTDTAKPLSVIFSTIITNFKNPSDTCNTNISSTEAEGWLNPQLTTYEFGKDLLGDPSSGFPITDAIAIGKKLYVTVNNTNGNNNGTFFRFDISTPTAPPTFLFGVDNSPTVGEGLAGVAVSSHYAYVANAYTGSSASCTQGANCSQLQVIDINNPNTPVAFLKIASTTTGGKLSYGKSIFYNNGYVYIGLSPATATGSEFNVIDVGGGGLGSPTSPKFVRGYKTGVSINSINVKDNYAYLAIPNGGVDSENLTILDVSSPYSAVSRVGGYSPSGGSDGESVKIFNNKIYLGRTFASTADKEFHILNAPSASFISSKDIGTGNNTTIYGILVKNTLAFVITGAQFQVWDTSSGINQYATPISLPGGKGTAIGCTGKYIYVGSLPSSDKGYLSVVYPGPINQAPLIASATPSTVVYGSTSALNTTGGSGSGAVTFSAGASTGCSVSGSTLSVTNASGTCSITATKASDTDYNSATSSAITVTLQKATQATLNAVATPSTVVYGSTSTLSSTGGSGSGAVAYTAGGTGGCSVSGTTLSVLNASLTCNVTATKATDNNYNVVSSIPYLVVLNKATPSLSVTNSPVNYNGSPQSATVVGSVAGVVSNIKYNGSSTAPTNGGTYAVTADFTPSNTNNYNTLSSSPAGNFVIKIPFTYTINNPSSLPALTKGGASVNFTATVTMAAGATPQLVTLTPPKPKNNINANTLSCTPIAVAPYTCSVTFSYSASNGSSGTYTNQVITSTPNGTTGVPFTITVN